jgi:3-dehydroquinate synthase
VLASRQQILHREKSFCVSPVHIKFHNQDANPIGILIVKNCSTILGFLNNSIYFDLMVCGNLCRMNAANPLFRNNNIVLTGFMGTGKSTVGRALAAKFGRAFVDMDAELEGQFGKPIAAVFEQEGEIVFRQVESELCQRLARAEGLVISTGGGALVNEINRQTLAKTGILVCLNASIDEILQRVGADQDRPLLTGSLEQKRRRVSELLNRRRSAYAAIPHQVETTGQTVDAILAAIDAILQSEALSPGATALQVDTPQGAYPIYIGDRLLDQVGVLLKLRGLRPGSLAIVSNDQMPPSIIAAVATSADVAGFEVVHCSVPEGEQHKTLATVASLYDQFLAAKLDRKSPIIAVGGGVVGDMTGFAAATYLRGAPFVQIPTTLLAMVDASVGGKTGVDLPQGKNLVGAFKQPEFVLIDTTTLQTLPQAELRSGLAEVIKHAIIDAPALFTKLEADAVVDWRALVAEAVYVKVKIVMEDPYEEGRRALLNLGHTFGHAIELVSNFSMRHGEAVAVGMAAAAGMAAELEACDPALAQRITALIQKLGLPTAVHGYSVDAILAAMGHDKKRAGKKLRFIIPKALGDVAIIDDPGADVVRRAIQRVLIQN